MIESKISGLLVYDLKLFTFTRPQGIKQEKDGKTIHYSYTCINKNNNEVKKTFTINNVFNDYIYAFNRIRKSNNNSNEKFTIE